MSEASYNQEYKMQYPDAVENVEKAHYMAVAGDEYRDSAIVDRQVVQTIEEIIREGMSIEDAYDTAMRLAEDAEDDDAIRRTEYWLGLVDLALSADIKHGSAEAAALAVKDDARRAEEHADFLEIVAANRYDSRAQ